MSFRINTSGSWIQEGVKNLPLKRCQELLNVKGQEKYYNFDLTYWYCIDFDIIHEIGGNWDGNFTKFLQILTKQYINTTSNNNSCAPFQEIQNQFVNN